MTPLSSVFTDALPLTPEAVAAEQSIEEERARIAHDLHDDLGGDFVSIKMAVAQLRKGLEQAGTASDMLNERLAQIDTRVDAALASMHRLIDDLRPAMLDFGIVAAMEWHASEFTRQCGLPCSFTSDISGTDSEADSEADSDADSDADLEGDSDAGSNITLAPHRAMSLFRIFSEALTNAARHAHASQVKAHLTLDGAQLQLTIEDDGTGISAQALQNPQSRGLRGMRHRVLTLGGTLMQQAPTTASGTRLCVRIPLL
ncbi:histidine kinase [Herbaspirillum sp. RTI4]|uniref:sensor histidine kinase n=1 Tax=Herbaspirillum sp. RTI4 TaxID=3048640 RepID=UPI002AB5CB9D|nr:histidine kinase [Herbaspirillum sp. RTI4]MDY7579177.1 histidine kinase [Herbaspirillum sp. RTI4]MEA9983225.1 histidine kinase [Herbaspirillum sp. RTI4]